MTMDICRNRPGCKCPCQDECPLEKALRYIGGKWKIPILCALSQDGTTRYNELRRKINGITNTMLASSLRELETDGLVCRHQYMEMPVRVEYALTDKCGPLLPILGQLAAWGAGIKDS
jgi:DNA-binding HxlR family transcriptional regulator